MHVEFVDNFDKMHASTRHLSSSWAFICPGEASLPIWDDLLQQLNPCWRNIFYGCFDAMLLVSAAYNTGIVSRLPFSREWQSAESFSTPNNSRKLWRSFFIAQAVLNVSVAAIFALEIALFSVWQSEAGIFAIAVSMLAVACFAVCGLVDIFCARRPQAGVLSTAAFTTQIVLWIPIYVLAVFDFKFAVSKASGERWIKLCYIVVFALQTMLLIARAALLIIKWRHARQLTYSRMPSEIDQLHAGNASPKTGEKLGVAEDGLGRGVLSFIFFLWVNPLIKLGSSKPLETYEQLFFLPDSLQSMRNTDYLAVQLDGSVRNKTKLSRIYLIKALLKVFGWRWIALGVFQLLISLINYIPPLMLSGVVSYLEIMNSSADDERRLDMDPYSGFYYAGGIIITSFVAGLLAVHCNFQISHLKISVRGACMDMVYRKLLHVRACDLDSEMESSQVMNLIGTDCERVVDNLMDVHYFWAMPIYFVVTLYLLYLQVGIAFAGGVAFALVLIPFNFLVARWVGKMFDDQMREQDNRVNLLTECLAAMRVIKLHAWEPYFHQRLQKIRDKEMRHWTRLDYLDVVSGFFWESTPMFVLVVTFTLYIVLGNTLTAAKTFTTIAIFRLFMVPMLVMPWMITGTSETYVSIKRLQKYFALKVLDYADYYDSATPVTTTTSTTGGFDRVAGPLLLEMNNVSLGWSSGSRKNDKVRGEKLAIEEDSLDTGQTSSTFNNVAAVVPIDGNLASTLQQISFKVRQGELIGVVGRVGSGKTSLLMAIIAEMQCLRAPHEAFSDNKFSIQPDLLLEGFAVALQDVWIQQGTVKENILCCTSAGVKKLRDKRVAVIAGIDETLPKLNEFDEERYNEIIDACALRYDVLGALPHGDATEIGEHGVTLSGGQRARIALARACYADKPVVLLDDPLSAVDANVARHIFEHCIRGVLRNKTVLLVTHHVEFLRQAADRVVVMQGGRILKCGVPNEVLNEADILFAADQSAEVVEKPSFIINERREPELRPVGVLSDAKKDQNQNVTNGDVVIPVTSALIEDEEREYGVVRLGVWREFFRFVGWWIIAAVGFGFVIHQTSLVGTDYWLAHWTSMSELADSSNGSGFVATTTHSSAATSLRDNAHQIPVDNWFYLKIYIAVAIFSCLCSLYRATAFVYAELNVVRRLHDMLLLALMCATQQFYDTTPSGRIINRYGSDIGVIHSELPSNIHFTVQGVVELLGAFTVICIGLPWFALAIVPVLPWYLWVQNLYRKTAREVQRILALTRSPIYSWFAESIKGLPHIRAMRMSERFYAEFRSILNANQRVCYTEAAASQWLDLRLQMVGAALVSTVVILALAVKADAAITGLALSYALAVVATLSSLLTSFVATEQHMISVERIMQYITGIKREEHEDAVGLTEVLPTWPQRGEIQFENVKLRYRTDLPDLFALNGVTLSIKANEKIAIVGRTGAGKSSMLQALFRTVKLAGGRIVIDGMNIADIRLKDLRSRLAIIPQSPMLFDASLRQNIDPLQRHSDEEVIDAVKSCFLENVVQKLGGWAAVMDESVRLGEAGARLSMGERQLVCLARALVLRSKILCLDEATASVDHETDEHIQRVLQKAFENSTVICIAHRIQTIRDYDRVAVMKDGCVVECGSPQTLMSDADSLFYQLATAHS